MRAVMIAGIPTMPDANSSAAFAEAWASNTCPSDNH
jgi:hypothetical protein